MAIAWNGIFNSTDGAGWTGLKKGQIIPKALRSVHQPAGAKDSKVGLGIVRVVANILTGNVQFGVNGTGCCVSYLTSKGVPSRASREGGVNVEWQADSPTGFLYLVLAEAWWLNSPNRWELKSRWSAFIDRLRVATLTFSGTFDARDLQLGSNDTACNEALMALVDSVYRSVELGGWQEVSTPVFTSATAFQVQMLEPSTPNTRAPFTGVPSFGIKPSSSLTSRVTRLIRRGEKALLVGPSGTFKTETAKRAALEAGRKIVSMSGRPGLEDRDFFQGFVTSEHGFRAVDGPLARAWRLAQSQPVCLIVNELLRFEPMYLSALVGALDTYSAEELTSMGVCTFLPGRYYLLEMPNGERIPCLTNNLSVICTTNIGDDFQQLGQTIDAALLRRLGVILEVREADETITRTLYRDRGAPPAVVERLIQLELMTRRECKPNGLLERTANPGVILTLLAEARDLVTEGCSWSEALLEAAQVTVVPYCVPRGSNGLLEDVPSQALERDLQVVFKGV